MDIIQKVIGESIILLAESIIYWIYYNGLYDRKQRGVKSGLILAVYPVSLVIGGYCSSLGLPILLKAFGLVIIGCFITKLLFNANWRSIIIHQVIAFLCSIIGDSLAMGILTAIQNGVEINEIFNNSTLLMQAGFISKMFQFFIILLFIKKFGKETNRYTISETSIFMLQGIAGMACLVLIMNLSVYNSFNYNIPSVFVLIVSILVLASYFVFYGFFDNYIKKRNQEQDVMKVHFYNQGQYEYYATLEQENLNMKKMYQDMKNHLAAIRNLNKENQDLSNSYIEKCLEEVEGYNEFFDTGNQLADIILYEKCNTAKNHNIKTEIMIQKGSLNSLETIDLCAILTNSFDNAMAGCMQCKGERLIQVKSITNDAAVIFTIKNNYETLPALNTKGELITSKQNKEEHGLVMQSLRIAATKYNGDVEISINKEKKEFLLIVMIPIVYQSKCEKCICNNCAIKGSCSCLECKEDNYIKYYCDKDVNDINLQARIKMLKKSGLL
ncbi:sensor histidine kinase YesM [Lachnotalea glycerini]|uniref:Sensor histidine kinase YesM n=1 Tax=Lachnotalea glycerini TaxID=1763509 RepID=A0A318ETH3_9FIRM|nr:GHKL domain-containing protein [Lachnotalea glycerini]PXV91548.1 sensor histidine kinase YesM [Lachnotalea glycerini]